MSDNKKFFIIDSHALIYRAYHAVPQLTSKNRNVNAVYGFFSILLRLIDKYEPAYIVCAFDSPTSTFIKKKKFTWYKANREKVPDELIEQFEYVKEILRAFNISIIESLDYEADDVVSSIAKKFKKDFDIFVITGDKDLLQLVDDKVSLIMPGKSFSDPKEINNSNVEEILGFKNKYLLTFKSLKGDPSDNIPGVPGIGDKTAQDLILLYGDLFGIYENIDNVKESLKQKLIKGKQSAYDSFEAAKLFYDIDVNLDVSKIKIAFDYDKIVEKLNEYDFNSLKNKYFSKYKIEENSGVEYKAPKEINDDNIKTISKDLEELKIVYFYILNNHTNNSIYSIFFLVKDTIYYIDDFKKDSNIKILKDIFSDINIEKVSFQSKDDMHSLNNIGIPFEGKYFDINLGYFILKGKNTTIKSIIYEIFSVEIEDISLLTMNGKFSLDDIDKEKLLKNSFYYIYYLPLLYENIVHNLEKDDLNNSVFRNIDLPLIKVLFDIEKTGIEIDVEYLKNLYKEINEKILLLENKIFKSVGKDFNISSSLQLSNVLYEDLKLPYFKKLKSGIFPTDDITLEGLSKRNPVVDDIRKYKELKKLNSTYTLSLVKFVDDKLRIHTTYNITGVSTGRLSSKNPNLQNLPNKTELGRDIRKAFIPSKNHIFISFDYSQIELRLMAFFSQDENMKKAFNEGLDIHTYTASQIFNKLEKDITKDERNKAKTINFGVIYGISSYGLSQQLGITRKEANDFIENYFKRFSSIKNYYKYIETFVEKNAFVETLFGRKRHFDTTSGSYIVKSHIFREAINMPIQGTCADIIKISMNKIFNNNEYLKYKAKILMQIHDELVFEVPKNVDKEAFIKLISSLMTDFKEIDIPLRVDSKYGDNLRDLVVYENK